MRLHVPPGTTHVQTATAVHSIQEGCVDVPESEVAPLLALGFQPAQEAPTPEPAPVARKRG